jgi:plasmid stabilization system protein ParE
MAHRLAPEVETELDDVWSDSIEIADRVIDSITDRFFLLATWPHIGRRRDGDLRPGLRSFPVGAYVICCPIMHGMKYGYSVASSRP